MTRVWTQEHVRLATAANRVSRRLMDLANTHMVEMAHPALRQSLIRLAADLRHAFRPRRRISSRQERAA
jgi:hypothetical protein